MEQLTDLLNNFDLSQVGVFFAVFASSGYLVVKTMLRPFWQLVEGVLGFIVSTLVVISLWFAILRIHVSLSFNVDKELFDNLLWLSALSFTPYYLIKYEMFERIVTLFLRTIELLCDLLVFSWFEERAKANRTKWRQRFGLERSSSVKKKPLSRVTAQDIINLN